MKKLIGLVFFFILFLTAFSQSYRGTVLFVANNTTAYGIAQPSGALVYDLNSNNLYELQQTALSTATLNTTANKVIIGSEAYFVNIATNQAVAGQKTFSNDPTIFNTSIQAFDANGLSIEDDGGTAGLTVLDGQTGLTLVLPGANNNIPYIANLGGAGVHSTTGFGANALQNDDLSANLNTAFGFNALQDNTTGSENTALGASAGDGNVVGNQNTYIGYSAGFGATNSFNTCVGQASGAAIGAAQRNSYLGRACGDASTGSYNSALGMTANQSNSGSYNTIVGYDAVTTSGNNNYNAVLGAESVMSATGADHNVSIGFRSGFSLTTGDDNILIGDSAGYNLTTESDLLYIDNSTSSTPLIYGEFDNRIIKFRNVQTSNNCDTVASAATITLTAFNNFVVSGTADIDSISSASTVPDWTVIYIEFSGTASATGLTDGKNLKLNGDFAYTPDDMICLQRRGNVFFEISRSVN